MATAKVKFRTFDNPPVVETVVGVQFAPLANLTSGYYGWFWKQFLDETWVRTSDAGVLPDQFEKFGDEVVWGVSSIQFGVLSVPLVRVQIFNAKNDRLIQIQNTRFLYNWQKQEGAYPRYASTRREFDALFARFCDFARTVDLGEVKPNQWEVIYVNHIPKGPLWNSPSDWKRILPGLLDAGQALPGLRFESVGEWHYEIEPRRGRLHIAAQPGRAGTATGPDVLMLQFTARGPILEKPGWSLGDGLDLGHEAIVRTFGEMASPEALKLWGGRE